MTVTQISTVINNVSSEILGTKAVENEDLSNIVSIGEQLTANGVDNYVKSLINHIGKVIFVNRPYNGNVPSVLMDSWEFGSILEKIDADIPEAQDNSEWNLQSGKSYDTNVFYKPTVSAKFFNKRVTFEVPISITERQVKESFSNAEQLNGFYSMIYSSVEKSMTLKIDSLVMRTINNMIAQTLADGYGTTSPEYTKEATTGVRAVNLLAMYNTANNTTLKAEKAITDPAFIRFATYQIAMYKDRLNKMSTLFNIGGKARFTPDDMLHVILLSNFANASDSYLQADTFHNELVRLPNYEKVAYWQGSGLKYDWASVSSINVKTDVSGTPTDVTTDGIIGVMFDRDALGVCNLNRRTTTNYNAKGEFFNSYFKFDAGYINDLNENFVVFLVK